MNAAEERELLRCVGSIEGGVKSLHERMDEQRRHCEATTANIFERLGTLEQKRAANGARASERAAWVRWMADVALRGGLGLGGLAGGAYAVVRIVMLLR